MNKGMSLAFLVAGIVLLVWGVSTSDSVTSQVTEFFTGSPTDKAIWLIIGGIVGTLIGLFGVVSGRK